MVGKNNLKKRLEQKAEKIETYSIKKFKVGTASVLIGVGLFFGAGVVEASDSIPQQNSDKNLAESKETNTFKPASLEIKSVENKTQSTREKVAEAVAEKLSTQSSEKEETSAKAQTGEKTQKEVDKSVLAQKIEELKIQIERIKNNTKQQAILNDASNKLASAEGLFSAATSQTEVDAKAKEISSLTNILKSIKAEEVSKENKNKDSRNGKKMEEGTGFRAGEEAATSTTTATGIAADVVDATETPAVKRPPYTERKVAEGLAKQIAWLDFSDVRNWTNVDIENGNIYLKEGSIYEKEIMPNYRIKLKVKSLKPFQATEIYRKRMEANNATPEEKATFNPNATNGIIDRTDNNPVRITAKAQDQWSEIKDNGINTNGRKTSIIAERVGSNIGVQFEVSGTYKGNPVRPAVVMTDAESANPGENIVFTTNGSGWQQIIDLKKNYTDAHRYRPLNYYTTEYKRLPDVNYGNDNYNTHAILNVGAGNKIVPKFFTNPDQGTGGLGTGVFGPGVTAGKYSVPVVLTKNATEVGMYVFSSGAQAAMIGVAPIDEGDAPSTYGEATHTMNTRDGLTGDEVKQPYLGSERPDADTDNTKNWYGDDDTDTADEGINQLLPDSLKGSEGNIIKANISEAGYYTLNIQAHTGGAERAYVRSWLDFNSNGVFDDEEASDIAEITEDGDVTLHFRNKTSRDAGSLLQAGTRVRISTSRDEVENPTGLAFSGEVEDFNAKITHPPKGDKQTTIGNATIGNNVEKQSATVHFTPKGKNIYEKEDVDAVIDTNVAPIYINNKTKKPITLSEENTYTVIGQGTYKFTPNGKDVDVEFTPAKGFVGKAHGITIRRQDTNKTTTDWGTNDEAITPNVNDVLNTMDGLYIPEVIKPTVEPTVNNAESSNLQGFSQKGKPTFTVVTSDTPVTASVKHPARLIDPRTNTLADSAIVDALDSNNNKVGTYKIAPETGEVTFTPNIDYKGEVRPVKVSVPVVIAHDKDDNDITVTKEATYTPRIIPVAPTAEASTTRDIQGKAQVSRIVFDTLEENADKNQTVNFDRSPEVGTDGEHVELDKETLTLVNASGVETNTVTTDQGEYVLDKVSKTITFTPKKEFVGTATAVNIRIKDMNGTKVETTYTPTVIEVSPTGKDSATSGPQGLTQKSPVVFNQREETDGKTLNFDTGHERVALKPETLTLLNGTAKVKSITVENVGTYELVDNNITFTPAPAYHGTAEGVNVQVEDENGKVVTKKYIPTVNELTVTSEGKTTKNIQGETQEGTPTFTIPAESTNATVTSRKLVDPADQTEKDSVTVAGKGTFTIDGNGKVTFVPVPTYKEDVPPITVKATVTVTNAKNESTTITSTASYKPIIVAAEIDKAPATSTNLQGLVQTGTPTFTPKTIEVDGVQKTITVQPNSYKLVKDGLESESLPAYKAGTSEQIGTYTINPQNGTVTFTPTDKTYTGAVQPVDVQATGSNGIKVQTTYTPTITPVTPTKEPSATTDVQGKKQVSRIVLDIVETDADKDKTVNFNKGTEQGPNGERVNLNPDTLTLLNDVGAEVTSLTTSDGEYVLDKANKTITFTPNKTFTGPAKPVKVQIKDVNGTKVETTYTPTVTDVTITSEDKESSAPQGKTQTGTPTFKVSSPDVRITGYKLLNPTGNTPVEGNEIEVPDQGTYRINPTTGEVTFIPKPGFTGPATGITVQATDENGETKDAKYKPTVNALTITPQPVTTTNIQGETQEGTPTFSVPAESNNVTVTSRKLVDPVDQTEKDSVKVEGKGTFTIDGNGKVTFTPLPTYKGDVDPIIVKATVTITNDKNESTTIPSTTTYKPIIVSAEINKEPATSTNLQGLVQTGTPAFKSKTVDVNGTPKTITVQPNSYKLVKDGLESNTLPAYKAGTTDQIGTYTIDSATGQVTFTPSDKTYSGEVAPVDVQATGSNGVKVETTYTPIITPVTPTAEKSATSDVQGKKQTSSIVLDTPENSVDKDKTVNFNKGSQVGANGERVELDASTLTLLDGTNEVTSLTTNDGEYVLDKTNRTITFTPKKTFVGTATPVKVQIKDANGTKVETTYTPTVTDITMKGAPATTSAPQGQTQTGTPTFTISSPEVSITGYKLLNPNGNTPVEGNEIEVPNEGTYRINPTTGQVTFIPKPGFTGPATGISVQATDGNGETAEAKYTPTVNAVTVTPGDKTTTNIQGVTQEETPIFTIPTESTNATVTSRKLVDPADQTEKDSVTVAGKGTFTIDGNGKVVFTPEPTFKGEIDPIKVNATVTITNAKNESATITSTATYKPIIVAAEIDKAPATSTNLQGLVQTGTPTFTSKTVDVNGTPKTITVQPNSYKLVKGEAESESLPAYKAGTTEQIGTYAINPATGVVTFTPTDKTYTGAVEPVSVQATGSNGVKVQTTYTPTITPVTPTKEPSATTDVQGKKQVSRIVLDIVETDADKDKTVNFNKGTEQGPNGERVNLNPDTLTLLNDVGAEVTSLTTSDGEYVLDKANKTITFTPNKTFTGPAKPVKVQIKDVNGTKVETTYTPTVTEVTPTGKDSATTGLQGFAQKSPIVFNQKDEEDGKTVNFDTGNEKVALKPDTLTLLNGNEKVKTITVPDVGTYELKDNAITFTPLPSYHGTPEGVTVQIEDENGKAVTKKYVPTVTQVTPTGTNTTSSGLQGKVQTGKPVFNGGVPEVPMNDEVPATLEGADQDGKVVIAGKGTYTVAKDGTVTFTPDKNFVGEAPAVTVKRVDKNGTIATATYTPTVTDVTMTSVDKTSEAPQGKTQTGTPEFSISTPSVRITEYKLVDPTNNMPVEEVEVANQGTYSIDKATGEVTFVPKPGFTGPTTGITVRATDENGETKDATYTPSVTPLKVTPENKTTTNIQGLPQEATPTFKLPKGVTNAVVTERKLIDPITKALTNSVTVDGKGTFTINANGKVTFTPVPSYVGDVPAIEVQGTITVLNGNNDSTTMISKASYKPIIVPIELEKTPAESTNVQGLVQKGTPTFTPQSVDVNGVEKTVTVKPNSYKLVKDGTETDTIPAYKKDTQEVIGKYTIDPQTGEVTFTPTDKTYTGEVEPATVQATGSNNVKVQTTYTPIIKPVKPVGTNAGSEGIQGAPQSGTPTFKSGNESIPMTVSATNPAKLVDPTTNQPIEATEIDAKNTAGEKVGKYTINPATGEVTFTPEPGFSGTPVPATVQAKDGNGTPTTATYTPVVKAAVPSGDNQVTSDIQGAKQTVTPVFTPGKNTVNNQEVSVPFEATSKAKLIDPSKTGDEREVTTLVVENQGTYTIDDNGVVTFTPLPTFKGEATPVSIERKDKNGTVATATFKPSVVGVTPSATEATTTKVQGATQETPVTFTPGKATIGTAEKTVPMDPASYKLLGGQEGKTPLDTVPAMSEDGTKEVGTYTIKVVDGKPVVTFTPTDKTYAGKLKPVTVQGKDTNGTEATTTYTPVITPIVPTAENGTSEGPQGVEQTGSVTFKPGKEPGTENTPVAIDKTKMTLLGTDGNPVESLTVSKDGKEIGIYTLVKDLSGVPTGEVKFTPTDKSYVGEVPAATVQVKDANGTPATATYTPTFTEVNPTSKPSETTGFQGLPQTSRVVLDEKDEADNTTVNFDKGNDKVALVPSTLTLVNADGAKVTSLTVPNEGTYELNNGVITFTPLPTFHGKASGVSVQAEDVNGKVAKTTYTPTVTELRPVGTNAGSEGIQGAPQSGTPTFKSGNENIPMTVSATNPAKLVDPTTNQPIEATEIDAKNTAGEKVGKYTINPATGEVTFTPEPGFSGTPVPATVQAKDGNGTPTTATYTPVVKAAVPSGDNQVTSDIQGAKQTVTPVFTPGKNTVNNQEVSVPFEATSKAKLIDPSKTGDEREVTTLVVENQGTYTIDDNGVVTFTPLPTFKGEATPVSIERKDKNGTVATATFKPSVVGVTPSATEATTTKVQGATQETPVTFTPGKATIGTAEKTVPMDPASYKLLGGQEGKTPLDTVPAMSEDGTKEVGTYTIKVVDGKPVVTFTPTDKTYAGKLKPVTVQGKDTNGTEATTTYTPVITPIVPTAENGTSEGPQGVEQTGSVTFKPGKEPGTENTPVAIDKTKMTLLGTDGNPVESLTVSKDGKEIGIYTLVKDLSGVPTGEVKFTPTDKSYVGEVPAATVQVKDANGTPATATYTPTFTEVNPTGEDSATTGLQGLPQTSRVVLDEKDETDKTTVNFNAGHEKVTLKQDTLTLVNAAGDKVTTVTVPDVGTYELKDGVITFTPLKTFKGKPEGVTVQVEDANGKVVKQKYVPNVVEVLPTGKDTTSTGLQGKVQTGKPEFTPGSPEVPMNDESPATFEDGSVTKTVDKVGTYTVAKDGTVTFTPDKAFSGEAPEVTVKRVDKNGTSVTAKYKPTVEKVTPTGKDTTSTGLQGKVQTGTPEFTPGNPEVPMDDEVPATFDNGQNSKIVDKVGTYTVAKDGTVTFTPDKDFSGEAPEVTVKRVDKNGTSVTAKYQPTVTKVTPTGKDTTSTGLQGKVQTGTPMFTPGNPEVPMDDEVPATFEDGSVTKTVDKVGTYTVAKDGTVTFTPDKAFSGEAPEVTVKRVDKNGTAVTAKYKPTVEKVTPTGKDTTSTGLQGKVQTGTPVFTPGNPEVPMDDESPATFEDGNITKTIDKVGTYTVAKDGTVTFIPDKDFVGEAPEVTVKRVDKNGTAVTAKYKPIVAKVLPTGEGSETEGAKGKPQTSAVVFDKKDEDKSTVNFNKGDETVGLNPSTLTLIDKNGNPSTEVKVPGEGTYTLANNVITFTPENDFAGKASGVTVQVKDINGTPLEKTYTPTVRSVTTFVDPSGNPITVDKNNKPVESEVDGSKQPTKDIYGYKFVRTETDNKGNTKHIYEQAEGKSVKVAYVSTTGESLNDTQVVTTKDKFIGTDYDASIEALKLERIEKDGKVYLLKERKTDSAAENGKLSDQEQTVTYVYEEVKEPASNQKYGNVVVVYKDKFGRPISGITESGKEVTSTVIDTPNSPLTTKYDTTDHKPQIITTKDGKKYKLIKVLKTSDAEKSGVKARTSVITYVYESLDNTTEYPEAHIGLVLVNYLDEEGNPISGKTPEGKVVPNMVVDTEADLVGKDYDTTDHKVSTIIVENGDVYELLKVSETSVEKGKLTEGATNVNYIYHKVVTKFVDENGKEIKSPEKGRTDKKDIPEYTFKESKKDENGNTVHVYTKKTPSTPEQSKITIWTDEKGNPIKSEKGTKGRGTVPGYEFVRTTVDKDGNTVHIFKKTPSTPEQNKITIWTDGKGNPIRSEKGTKGPGTVPGYEFVRTTVDKDGNTVHIFRKSSSTVSVPTNSPEEKVTSKVQTKRLANTGATETNTGIAGLGLAILGGLLAATKRRKDK